MIVNAPLSSPQIFPFCQTNILLWEAFSWGKKTLWAWIRLFLPSDVVFSDTDRIPWGKQPVPTRSLGTERLLSSGRYFYLDNSSGIRHWGAEHWLVSALQSYCTARPRHHWAVEYSKGITPPGDVPRVSQKACSRSLSSLPVLCCLPGTSICEMASGLRQSPVYLQLCGCTFSEKDPFRVKLVFWLCTAPLSAGQRLGGRSWDDMCTNISTAS